MPISQIPSNISKFYAFFGSSHRTTKEKPQNLEKGNSFFLSSELSVLVAQRPAIPGNFE